MVQSLHSTRTPRSTHMANPLMALADAAAAWRTRDMPREVEWCARRALLDWFAATLPGCIEAPATLLADAIAPCPGAGAAVCYVDGRSGPARRAALLNAVASHTVEFDDIYRDGGYHPGSPTVAAALALAQDRSLPHARLHRAIVAGYEVGCRVALAIQPSHYAFWHTTSTVGTIGAAVAAAIVLDCEAEQIGHAIALASSFAGGHQQNLQAAGMAKALHAGHAAEAGMLAGLAAAKGVTGSLDSLHGASGFAAATSASAGDWAAALDGLGDWTPITRMTVKNHGCCGHIFPALDGLEQMRRRGLPAADDIAAIHVEGYGATFRMCNRPEPQSVQDARFSVQYCVAALLILGAVRLDAFRPETLARDDIRSLMRKVTVAEAPDLAAAYPRQRMARISVRFRDGGEAAHFQTTRKGDPEDPLSDGELIAKFDELASAVLSPRTASRLRDLILYGAELPGEAALDGSPDSER